MALAETFKTYAASYSENINARYAPFVQIMVKTVEELQEAGADVSLAPQNLLRLSAALGPTYALTIEGCTHLVFFQHDPIGMAVSAATLPEILASESKREQISGVFGFCKINCLAQYTPRLGENTSDDLEMFRNELAVYAAQLQENRKLLQNAQKKSERAVGFGRN